MDDQRFDAMTRMIASGVTRRRLVLGLAGGAGAVVLAGPDAGAAKKARCTRKGGDPTPQAPCCNTLVKNANGRCDRCVKDGNSCANGERCCAGLRCGDGVCCDPAFCAPP